MNGEIIAISAASAGTGAAVGTAAGSFIPGIGNAAGLVIGSVVGGVSSAASACATKLIHGEWYDLFYLY